MRDLFREILTVIIRNPIRIILSGIGVSWGIMTILIMLGMINGLEYGIKSDLEGRASNSMVMWTMSTTKAYGGFKPGRRFELYNEDIEWLIQNVQGIEEVAPRLRLGGWRGSNNVTYETKTGAFDVNGDYPSFAKIQPMKFDYGRWMNQGDIDEKRKVCVIGKEVRRVLFGAEDPLGKSIRVQGVMFRVVGVFSSVKQGEDAEEDSQTIFIPFTTFQRAFNMGDEIGWLSILSDQETPVNDLQERVLAGLKVRKSIHPDDKRAFGAHNMADELKEINDIMLAMRVIGIFVGALILLAGIIGIINIMLITVGERSKEFGIRRSLGATPVQVIGQVLSESAFLTTVAGLVGLVWGVAIVLAIKYLIQGSESEVFRNPSIGFIATLVCTGTMIVFGIIGGLLPAMRAVAIKPVDALRADG